MKCSGEETGCRRCTKQSLVCHYSTQKQMGRPTKRRMREAPVPSIGEAGEYEWPPGYWASLLTAGLDSTTALEPPDILPPIHLFPQQQNEGEHYNLDITGPGQLPEPKSSGYALPPVPATSTPWPDFSEVSASSSYLPGTTTTMHSEEPLSNLNSTPSSPNTDSTRTDSTRTGADCACLSCLYLCLSNISTVSSFPITKDTLCSLSIAARTARDVIRCEVCPTNFAKGVQNVMLTATLLTVAADCWVCVSKANASELGQQTVSPQYVSLVNSSPDPAEAWRCWLRQVVRRAVIGGAVDEYAGVQCSQIPDLLSVIKEMEARQRRWHSKAGLHPFNGLYNSQERSSNEPTDTGCHHRLQAERQWCDEEDAVCLRVIGNARAVLSQLNFEPHEYPDGVVP